MYGNEIVKLLWTNLVTLPLKIPETGYSYDGAVTTVMVKPRISALPGGPICFLAVFQRMVLLMLEYWIYKTGLFKKLVD